MAPSRMHNLRQLSTPICAFEQLLREVIFPVHLLAVCTDASKIQDSLTCTCLITTKMSSELPQQDDLKVKSGLLWSDLRMQPFTGACAGFFLGDGAGRVHLENTVARRVFRSLS